MKHFLRFTHVNCITKQTEEALGTDSYLRLDGRLSSSGDKITAIARKRRNQLAKVQSYIGFNYYLGDLHSNRLITHCSLETP